MLLADDIKPLRRVRDRALDWLEQRRPALVRCGGPTARDRETERHGAL
jgi:hypothetical protein